MSGNENICLSELKAKQLLILNDPAMASSQVTKGAVSVIILPETAQQFAQLNKMAIVGISFFSKKPEPLPVEKIFFVSSKSSRSKSKIEGELATILAPIFPLNQVYVLKENNESTKKLGTIRQDQYYFIPIRLLLKSGVVGGRWKEKNESFEILKSESISSVMPNFIKTIAENETKLQEDPSLLPDPKLTIDLLNQHFCLFR